jgi:hypothetical protein
MASIHDSVPPYSLFIIAINALNFLQFTFPFLGEVFAPYYTVMMMVTYDQDCLRWAIKSVFIKLGKLMIFLITFTFFSSQSFFLFAVRFNFSLFGNSFKYID